MDALFSDYEEIRKSGLFDPEYYLATYPDVVDRNVDPLVHYLEEGAQEGRNPHADFDGKFYLEQCRRRGEAPANPLLHYLRIGAARGFAPRRDKAALDPADQGAAVGEDLGRLPILVAIEALEVGEATDGRRVSVTGWALAAAPIAEITVSLDGAVCGTATYGLARPDVARLYPDHPAAAQCGFVLGFALPARRGPIAPLLTVRTEDGEIGERPLPVEIPAGQRDSQVAARRPPDAVDDPDLKLHIDAPLLIGGAVEAPVRGNLQIAGWALARAGVAAIEITIDDTPVALADYGLRRLDIRAAFPEWTDALASGYQALVPHRLLPKGSHTVSVTLRDRTDRTTSTRFTIEVEALADAPGPWALRRKISEAELELDRRLLEQAGRQPMFAVMLRVAENEEALRRAAATIESVRLQAYPNWRLLIVPEGAGSSSGPLRDRLLAGIEGLADRAEIVRNLTPRALAGIAAGAGSASGEMFIALIAAGDLLGADALFEMALAAAADPDADFLYSDERSRNPASGAIEAFFKPQWSPDLMLAQNYVGRLWCARIDLLRAVADPGEAIFGQGEYDLALRLTEAAKEIHHVAAVLCERGSDADDPEQSRRALARALARRGIAGEIRSGPVDGTWRLKRTLLRPGMVSILIPTCAARGLIETCINSLRQVTAYRNYEIVCLENIAPKDRKWRSWLRQNADRVIATREPFNWARFSNLLAAEAKGDYLLFLNDDIEITDPDWLAALVEEAQRPEVGVVGARLFYPDRRVQHGGMFLAALGQARHAFRYAAEDDPGYFGLALTQRNVIAVTGACLLTRRDTFDALGGFDESQSIVNNDLDYSLRAWQRGFVNVYTPHATLIHHEAISRNALDDDYDVAAFDGKWRDVFLAGDPFFSPHLSKHHDDFAIDHEPTRLLVTGRPGISRADIRRILVVKLDHIGDCIIALPAIRRLQQHFPDARITVLTSRASQPVWALEPSVAEMIEFDFFHAVSGRGELERSEADWKELHERLLPEHFDLAVDLRKHTETRPVLQHTGARHLAGFDFRNQFPWLDVALEWTGDQIYARKRQHNGDDLVNLVDAVAAACEPDRTVIAAPIGTSPALAALRQKAGTNGPLICVHPTVGNDARQWPIEYFAAVIDRLVEEDDAQIVLIGAAGEEAVADTILQRVRRPDAITSLVGTLPLAELPSLLAGATLFLGNNSGPKHIAAGLGVPTVGIHSGTEDVREWGPVGPRALAVAREVVCAPCYLAHAADCRRGLACLRQLEPARVYEACKRLLPPRARAPSVPRAGRDAAPVARPLRRTASPNQPLAHAARR